MATSKVTEIMKQAEGLSTTEQLELIALLAESARASSQEISQPTVGRKWSEAMGIAPDLLNGEDAQAWVSRTRREADESRERALRGSRTDTTP